MQAEEGTVLLLVIGFLAYQNQFACLALLLDSHAFSG